MNKKLEKTREGETWGKDKKGKNKSRTEGNKLEKWQLKNQQS